MLLTEILAPEANRDRIVLNTSVQFVVAVWCVLACCQHPFAVHIPLCVSFKQALFGQNRSYVILVSSVTSFRHRLALPVLYVFFGFYCRLTHILYTHTCTGTLANPINTCRRTHD